MNTLFDPEYKSDEYVAGLEVNHTWRDLTFTGVIGFHDAHVWSQQDYLLAVPSEPFGWGPQFFEFPGSSKNRSGIYDSEFLFDQSNSHVRQWTYEFRVATDFEGPLNFTGGMLFLDYEWDGDYYVWGAGLEAFDRSILLAPPSEELPKGFSLYDLEPRGSYFLAETHPYELDTRAAFGEVYYDLTQSTRVTLGARLTHDRKQVSHRSGNLIVGALSPFEQDATRWTKWTTKVSIDQRVEIPTGDALLYATFSSGYKAGGFNNPVQEGIERQFAPIFDPELIDSYEVGVKSSLFDNRVIINLSGFFYDYKDFQVSKIVSRTSINENIDAEIWGGELETVFQPFPGLRLEASASYLDTDIQDALSIDTRDPSAGVPGTLAVKDFVNGFGTGGNSVITDVTKLGDCVFADPVASAAAGCVLVPGFEKDLSGNELPYAPEWSLKLAAQYTMPFLNTGYELTFRVDHYWQDDMYSRIFNDAPDKISSWSQTDAQIRLSSPGQPWMLEFWVKNIQDNDDITGHYFTDETSANFTNLFILEPRITGVTLRREF